MKKLIYILTATALALVSCNKAEMADSEMVTLDYNVAVPAALTKVATIGDASHVNELVCAVYEDGEELTRQTIEYIVGDSFSYKPSLYIGREYQIVFWAHKKDYYDLSDLTDITWKDGFKTNDENADAFTFTETVKINSDKSVTVVSSQESGSTTRDAILRRPFVGLNLKLKVSDIINRYRLSIVTKLMEMQSNELAMDVIAKSYMGANVTYDMALSKANKHIDEVIDAFNAIEEFIHEIDVKNKNYINSTIGKIKFLLSEDDNIVGKINRILKHVKDSNKNNKLDKSMRLVDSLYDLRTQKVMAGENSLYTPRGSYVRNPNMLLGESGIDLELDREFLDSFKSLYNEKYLGTFLNANLVDGKFKASNVITYDMTDNEFMQVVYCIIYAADNDYKITINNNKIEHKKFIIKDFEIERGR